MHEQQHELHNMSQSKGFAAVDLTDLGLFVDRRHEAVFDWLRENDPVHLQTSREYGDFWNLTRYDDVQAADLNYDVYSSRDIVLVDDTPENFGVSMFLGMDPPRHTAYRDALKAMFSASHLATMEGELRAWVISVLNGLPLGVEFDWVDRVSIEITSFVLAKILDFPIHRRRELIDWSDFAVLKHSRKDGACVEWAERQEKLMRCFQEFHNRKDCLVAGDSIGLVHQLDRLSGGKPSEFLGNILLIIVAGNDTTRNSITGGVVAFNRFPEELDKLKRRVVPISSAVSEIFRWQSPLAYMRRTAARDTMCRGRRIRAGDKVLLWFAAGNRDPRVFEQPHEFLVGRRNVSKHMSFGCGIHRCVGLSLAHMQLRILWEEVLRRFAAVEVVGDPVYVPSTFVKGYSRLPVRVRAAG